MRGKPEAVWRRTHRVLTLRPVVRASTVLLALPVLALSLLACVRPASPGPPPRGQNPSPMVEHTRAHERVPAVALPGLRLDVHGLLSRPVQVFVPAGTDPSAPATLLVHFHGAAHIAEHAVAAAVDRPYVAAVINLGAGSGVYERAFDDGATLDRLVTGIRDEIRAEMGADPVLDRLVLSAFSAGHGAVRALLRDPGTLDRIDGALLLDGIHTGYVPAGRVQHDDGALDTTGLAPYLRLLEAAIAGDKAVLITHSEVFPGTFASTTESVTWLVERLGVRRQAVLEWGPVGMQQLSEVRAGRLSVLGFAGNSAPDHMDHLHGMPRFLAELDP